MFVCKSCVEKDKVKLNNKSYALLTLEMGRGSYGPCEVCRKTKVCVDA